ncbi:MAG: lipopolysaccharide biosynthesis protein [Bacteroidales bacterium]|nr:lipopolysaccharide biosynthesis protein [Candidatus Liminaster caballi]
MANLKSLFKDTVIYGLSSIVGRFLNYMLMPLYTYMLPVNGGGYDIVTNLYAFVALIQVILTFGMETTCFRYANKENENPDTVFSTSIVFISALTIAFFAMVWGFIGNISQALGYADHPEYILLMAGVISFDAILAIPFCLLRYQKKSIKFASIRLFNICLSIGVTLFFFLVLHKADVYYIFAINFFCSALNAVFFIPELIHLRWKVDLSLLRRMFSYSWPILALGIAGIINQVFDKIIFPTVYPDPEEGRILLAEYGACVKIAMCISMMTQAFRYAYEPIVFAKSKDSDKTEYYAQSMKYFVIFTLLAFLAIMSCIDILKLLVGTDYRAGLKIVPIVMAAEIMMGIYFNLSFWYKLIDKTIWGLYFSLAGCVVLIIINLLLIPHFGYYACAWGGFAGYGTCMLLSYIAGQKINPIPYDMRSIFTYTALAAVLYACMEMLPFDGILGTACKLAITAVYVAFMLYKDFPLSMLISHLPLRKSKKI